MLMQFLRTTLVVCMLLVFPLSASAQYDNAERLRIHGTTDIEVFAVVIADYQRLHPGTEVVYEDIITQDLYARYLHDRAGPASPDLLISSGMDLQTKLVNDGHALPRPEHQPRQLVAPEVRHPGSEQRDHEQEAHPARPDSLYPLHPCTPRTPTSRGRW